MKERDRMFLAAVAEDLEAEGKRDARQLLARMVVAARTDPGVATELFAWAAGVTSTLGLFALSDRFGDRKENAFFNQVAAIDTASTHVRDSLPLHGRTLEGRLFQPQTWDTGWTLSLQADRTGYQCVPDVRLDTLEDYYAVEAVITHRHIRVVDPATLDLSPPLAARFTAVDKTGGPAIGQFLTWPEVAELRSALDRASLSPNAGVPRGDIGWSSRDLWHGTDTEAAEDIIENGISMAMSSKGYFGTAFYAADDRDLAASNYANMCDDDAEPAIVAFSLTADAHVLDLRNAEDAAEWAPHADACGEPHFDRRMRRLGIDAVYDRSMGGLAIYNPKAVEALWIEPPAPAAERIEPS